MELNVACRHAQNAAAHQQTPLSLYALLKITKDCVKTYFSEENSALELVCAGAPGAPAVGLSVPFHGGGRGHGG